VVSRNSRMSSTRLWIWPIRLFSPVTRDRAIRGPLTIRHFLVFAIEHPSPKTNFQSLDPAIGELEPVTLSTRNRDARDDPQQ
jgi:hypothetical protein